MAWISGIECAANDVQWRNGLSQGCLRQELCRCDDHDEEYLVYTGELGRFCSRRIRETVLVVL